MIYERGVGDHLSPLHVVAPVFIPRIALASPMNIHPLARVGAGSIAAAGAYWATQSPMPETVWCASVGVGYGLVALAPRGASGRAAALGLAVAALGTLSWIVDAVQAGDLLDGWLLFALGTDVAAISVLLGLARPHASRLPLRLGFGSLGVGGAVLASSGLDTGLWSASLLLVAAGAVLLVAQPPARAPRPAS